MKLQTAILVGLASLFGSAGGYSASAAGAAVVPAAKASSFENPSWSGYSSYPDSGTLTGSTAVWRVPAVKCQSSGSQRAAVWVGTWGTNESIKNGTAWLPQIGTDSQCSGGSASYVIVYQLYHSNSQWCSLLPEWVFEHTCKGTKPLTISSPTIHPGDLIQSNVVYNGKAKNGKLDFGLNLVDNTTGKWAAKDVQVAADAKLSDALGQGGVMVEDNDENGGLADFSKPIKLQYYVYSSTSRFKTHTWIMKIKKTVLATNSALKNNHNQYSFSVTWHHWK